MATSGEPRDTSDDPRPGPGGDAAGDGRPGVEARMRPERARPTPLVTTTRAHEEDVRRAAAEAGLRFAVHAVDVEALDDLFGVEAASARQEDDQCWGSLRYQLRVRGVGDADEEGPASSASTSVIVIKQWVNDWWPPAAADLNMRTRGFVRRLPGARGQGDERDRWWVLGSDHKGFPAASTIASGTNLEVRFPEDWVIGERLDPRVPRLLGAIHHVRDGPISWLERAYHPHRDIPDRGWGDGLVARLDWAPFVAAPEHEECPTPDLLRTDALPTGWTIDATGARRNPRLAHAERQWVVVEAATGDPLLWARAVPMVSRHPHPLLARADARYRLDWTETPVGWAGSLDTKAGHHVVLLERNALRIEVWVGLAAGMDRGEAAVMADRLFGNER